MTGKEQRRSLLGGQDGFQRIPETQDATMSIPLTQVKSHGQRSLEQTAAAFTNEKESPYSARGARTRSVIFKKKNDEETSKNIMGRIYDRVYHFSIITRYLLYIFPLGALLSIPIIIGSTVAPNAAVGPASSQVNQRVRIVWLFLWILIVWVSLWVGKLFAKFLPRIFRLLAGTVSPGVRKYSIAIKRLELPLALVAWAVVSLATFLPIMTQNPDRRRAGTTQPLQWETTMQSVLGAGVVSSLIFLAEKAFIVLVSVQYHQQTFDRKIKDSKRQVDLLSQLLDASYALFPPYCPEFAEEDYIINDAFGIGSSNVQSKRRSGMATPMMFLHNVGRVGDKITAAFGKVAHEVTGKAAFNVTASHSVTVEALEKKKTSEALARRIWMSLVVEGKEALYQEDVLEVLTDRPEDEAVETFAAIDRDGNGDVTLDEMIMTVCEMGRERKAIANSLHSIDSCISALDRMLLVFVFFAVIFVFVGFLVQSFVGILATAGTALLSLSFVFASTISEIFSSCIFLFVKHPFDVDDNVKIDKQQLIVERISLLYTVFKDIHTHTTTQCPNSVLNSVWIENISRSHKMREQLLVYISFDTTLEDIELLRRELHHFVSEKENSRDFDGIELEVTGVSDMSKLELRVEVQHKSNWQNETLRAARRSKFMCALVLALRKVPIFPPGGGYSVLGSADQPSYTVAVSDEQAAEARKAFKESQAAGRMNSKERKKSQITLPELELNDTAITTSAESELGHSKSLRNRTHLASGTETDALAALTARSPTTDPSRDWDDEKRRNPLQPPRPDAMSPMSPTQIDQVHDILRRRSTRGKRTNPAQTASYGDEASSSVASRGETAGTTPIPNTTSEVAAAGGYLGTGVPQLSMPSHPAEAASGRYQSTPMPSGSPPRVTSPPQGTPPGFGEGGVVTFPTPPNAAGGNPPYQRPPPQGPRYDYPPTQSPAQYPQPLNLVPRKSPTPPEGRSRTGTVGGASGQGPPPPRPPPPPGQLAPRKYAPGEYED